MFVPFIQTLANPCEGLVKECLFTLMRASFDCFEQDVLVDLLVAMNHSIKSFEDDFVDCFFVGRLIIGNPVHQVVGISQLQGTACIQGKI